MTIAHTSLPSLIFNTIRIKTLSVTIAVILLGQGLAWYDMRSIADQGMDYLLSTVIFICCLLLQIAVNLANDYFDGISGIDDENRQGPQRAIQAGLITPQRMVRLILATVFVACLLGLYLIYRGGWAYLGLGILSLFGVYAYSGGKRPLASLGLGELAVFLYFGFLAVMASYVLQTDFFNPALFFPAAQIGLLIAAIMLVNNIRDISSDSKKGKLTLVVRLGIKHAKLLFYLLITLPFFLIFFDPFKPLANLILIPFGFYLCLRIQRLKGNKYNSLLAQTSLLVLLWSSIYIGYLVFK